MPPPLGDVTFQQRGEHWLCLRLITPAWMVTNRAGVLLLKLANGSRSVADIPRLVAQRGSPVEVDHVKAVFATALDALLYGEPQRDAQFEWASRKLSAVHLHLTNKCNP